jgi:hypothetical protein
MPAHLKMDCASVDTEFDRHAGDHGQWLTTPALRHLDECERCRKLYHYLSETPPASAPSPELERRITEKLQASLQPVSRIASTPALTAQFLVVFAVVFAVASAGVSSLLKLGAAAESRGQLLGIGVILAVGAVLLAYSLARQMTPGSKQRIPAWGAIAILGAALLAGMVFLFPWRTPEAFLFLGWRCLRLGLMVAVPAAGVFWWLARRGASFDLTTLGATLGAVAGLLSVAVLQFRCSLHDFGHLVVWHLGVLALATFAGALIGRLTQQYSNRSAI